MTCGDKVAIAFGVLAVVVPLPLWVYCARRWWTAVKDAWEDAA